MFNAFLVVHIIIAAALVVLVLLQHGKGADMGAAFGSGASGTVFGSAGSGSFLGRVTAYLGAGFFVTSMILAILAGGQLAGPGGIVVGEDPQRQDAVEMPAAPAMPEEDLPADMPAPPPEEN
ncbi:preprotein translocase subunit SecG [Alkalilimnicola ehrlichii]|uniref:Protein-export membrane protein SecG n=1 Tax=Alkalilimnicola ehrlichii TaxID=351052 RepID=A0A3E0WZ79_9GAMM|nr:preprotein translocase subunit SecG [Alkalilimnicola ehrlichii]RFA30568.1 preprotein translocase subunit SecG [Alkalilimnicola ehrlichii]RFA38118.1 preprotein translocase subunit SecG [Alkalilimnicola ehrlichii]